MRVRPNSGRSARLLLLALPFAPPTAASASDFVGALRCRGCHPAEYAQWQATPHARAMERLAPEQRRDPRCTACHATSVEDTMIGVQCESCHGPGRAWSAEPIMKDAALARAIGLQSGADPRICARCHTADSPRLTPFDAQAVMPLVRHRKAAGAR